MFDSSQNINERDGIEVREGETRVLKKEIFFKSICRIIILRPFFGSISTCEAFDNTVKF